MLHDMADSKDVRRRATYEDVLQAPEHMVAEIVDGELFLSPRPAYRHATAGMALGGWMWSRFQRAEAGPGGWWFLIEPELHFGDDVLVPDIAGWRGEAPGVADGKDIPFLTTTPDWLCEVLSPSTAKLDRTKKLGVYGREHVSHVWFVEPLKKTLEVFVHRGAALAVDAVYSGDGLVRVAPFEAVEFGLDLFWPATLDAGER
jgi:Uma2 family endonuclease